MAWRLLTECYDRVFDGMTDSEWRVFCVICRHAKDETGDDCFPSTALLAQKSRLHKSTVPQQIQGLEEKGWIRTKQEPGKKRFFFVNVKRVLNCPFVGGQEPSPLWDSIPPRDPEPLCNPRPLRDPMGEGSDKSGGRGLTSQTRREHIKEQVREHISLSSLSASENGGASDPDLLDGEKVSAAKADHIPYEKVVALYNEKCASRLPKAMAPSDRLKSEIRGRWKDIRDMTGAKNEDETLAEFGKFFEMVSKSDWLCDPSSGWGKANLPWLLQRRKFELAMNGTYCNRGTAKRKLPPHKDPTIKFDDDYYSKVDPNNPWGISVPEALNRLQKDVRDAENAVRKCVAVPLMPYEFDAYTSLAYNIGGKAFCDSTLVRKLNAGDYAGACEQIKRWTYAGGKNIQGLVNRRAEEYRRCIGALR